MKRFTEIQNVGLAKYVVTYHDGVKKHNDGSDFMDMKIFKNKTLKDRFVRSLKTAGYTEN